MLFTGHVEIQHKSRDGQENPGRAVLKMDQ
jgi:hypothetical protein